MKNCCFECLDRKVGCHSECLKYKEWKEERDKEQKELRKFTDLRHSQTDFNACKYNTPKYFKVSRERRSK